MKYGSIIVGLIGGLLFVWHLAKVLVGTDEGGGVTTHHTMSLIGGLLLFAGIWLYTIGRKRARPLAKTAFKRTTVIKRSCDYEYAAHCRTRNGSDWHSHHRHASGCRAFFRRAGAVSRTRNDCGDWLRADSTRTPAYRNRQTAMTASQRVKLIALSLHRLHRRDGGARRQRVCRW